MLLGPTLKPHLNALKKSARQIFGIVLTILGVPRLPPGGSLGTPNLELLNLACRADLFSACKWDF